MILKDNKGVIGFYIVGISSMFVLFYRILSATIYT